jgi:hypothetical protein
MIADAAAVQFRECGEQQGKQRVLFTCYQSACECAAEGGSTPNGMRWQSLHDQVEEDAASSAAILRKYAVITQAGE